MNSLKYPLAWIAKWELPTEMNLRLPFLNSVKVIECKKYVNQGICPTPLTQNGCDKRSILCGVNSVWIQSFLSDKLVATTRLKNLVGPTIYP